MDEILKPDMGVPASPSGHSAEPEPSCTVSAVPASVPNAMWKPFAERYARLFTDGAMEALARGIGPLIVEEYDGEPYGVTWDKLDEREKAPVRLIALRGLRLLVNYCHASAIEARRAATENTGAVHESVVPERQTPNPSSPSHSSTRDRE